MLIASIWGQDSAEDSREAFSLIWSDEEQLWVAVYRLSLTVCESFLFLAESSLNSLATAFLRLTVSDPLLCLTVSATLREKPLALTQPKHPLALFLASIGSQLLEPPDSPMSPNGVPQEPQEETFDRLEEVNLLEGLLAGEYHI